MLPLDQVVLRGVSGSINNDYSTDSTLLQETRQQGEVDSAKLDYDLAWRLNSLRLMRQEKTGQLYDLVTTGEADFAQRAGIGIQLFLRSYSYHAAFMVLLTLVHIYPLVDNSEGSYLLSSANSTGARSEKHYWILKYCIGNSDQGMINFFGVDVHSYQMQVCIQTPMTTLCRARSSVHAVVTSLGSPSDSPSADLTAHPWLGLPGDAVVVWGGPLASPGGDIKQCPAQFNAISMLFQCYFNAISTLFQRYLTPVQRHAGMGAVAYCAPLARLHRAQIRGNSIK